MGSGIRRAVLENAEMGGKFCLRQDGAEGVFGPVGVWDREGKQVRKESLSALRYGVLGREQLNGGFCDER